MTAARVLIADDHALVREALRRGLESAGCTVVAEACDGAQAIELTARHRPDLVLMDISMPNTSGILATRKIRASNPHTAVIVLSMYADDSALSAARSAGAAGFLVKDSTTDQIVAVIDRLMEGQNVFPAVEDLQGPPAGGSRSWPRSSGSPSADGASGHITPLTKREEELLRVLATGVSLTEAAGLLYISVKTVKNHLSSIYQKFGCHDRAQAVLLAARMGIIQIT